MDKRNFYLATRKCSGPNCGKTKEEIQKVSSGRICKIKSEFMREIRNLNMKGDIFINNLYFLF
jgi:hypothetical protein